MNYLNSSTCLFFVFLSFNCLVIGQSNQVHLNLEKDKLAVAGYDVIEYYNHAPTKGNSTFESTYQGGKYHFSSLRNKLLFEENPNKYLPQYGGWCAFAMGYNGKKVAVDPESYTVEKGKLYLFYKSFFNDTKVKWIEKTAALKQSADWNWNDFLKPQKHENKN